jgi:hypothetical protein
MHAVIKSIVISSSYFAFVVQEAGSEASGAAAERADSGAISVDPLRSLSSSSEASGTIPTVRVQGSLAPVGKCRLSAKIHPIYRVHFSQNYAAQSLNGDNMSKSSHIAMWKDLSVSPQERLGARLEVTLMVNVAVESVSLRAVHQDAAFLLSLDGVCTSAALHP